MSRVRWQPTTEQCWRQKREKLSNSGVRQRPLIGSLRFKSRWLRKGINFTPSMFFFRWTARWRSCWWPAWARTSKQGWTFSPRTRPGWLLMSCSTGDSKYKNTILKILKIQFPWWNSYIVIVRAVTAWLLNGRREMLLESNPTFGRASAFVNFIKRANALFFYLFWNSKCDFQTSVNHPHTTSLRWEHKRVTSLNVASMYSLF